ncbi:MAG: CoA ester lyase [Parvibaculum sp.]
MRSLLFVPADSDKKLAKGAESGADALILDMEDSVALSRKDEARKGARCYLHRADRKGPKLIIRINALDSGLWEEDLLAVIPARPDMIMIPKTISGACVARIATRIDAIEAEFDIERGSTRLCCVATETAASLFNLGSYAGSSPRLAALSWGAEDLAAALGARHNKDEAGNYTEPYKLARTLTLLGAVAAGVDPLDTIYGDYRDEAGLEKQARDAARDGFTGKMAIHPAQVAIINRVFTPSEEELTHARAVVAAFAEAGDVGVVGLNGTMLDRPHLRQAERLIARAASFTRP